MGKPTAACCCTRLCRGPGRVRVDAGGPQSLRQGTQGRDISFRRHTASSSSTSSRQGDRRGQQGRSDDQGLCRRHARRGPLPAIQARGRGHRRHRRHLPSVPRQGLRQNNVDRAAWRRRLSAVDATTRLWDLPEGMLASDYKEVKNVFTYTVSQAVLTSRDKPVR